VSWYVYLVGDIASEYRYIGKTNAVCKRWREHVNASNRGSTGLLARALRKATLTNEYRFVFTVLSEHETEQVAFQTERFWISEFKTNRSRYPDNHGLNMTDGGEGCSGRVVSDATRAKISNSLKGHVVSMATRERLKLVQLGSKREFSTEHRAKLKEVVHNRVMDENAIVTLHELKMNGTSNAECAIIFGVSERTIRRTLISK